MSQVIVDPHELRRFAVVLDQEVGNLQERHRALEATRINLSEVWRDGRYANFEKAYLPMVAELQRFYKEAATYASYLREKAEKAERYLGRR